MSPPPSSSSSWRVSSSARKASTARLRGKRVGLLAHPREQLGVDVAAGDDQDEGIPEIVELGEGGQRGAGGSFSTDPRVRVGAHCVGDLALGDLEHPAGELAEHLDGERYGDADGEAVGEGRAAVAVYGLARLP